MSLVISDYGISEHGMFTVQAASHIWPHNCIFFLTEVIPVGPVPLKVPGIYKANFLKLTECELLMCF